MKDCIQTSESRTLKQFDEEVLSFHEAAAKLTKIITKLKGNSGPDNLANAEEMISSRVMHGSKVNAQELKELLSEVYYIKIGAFYEEKSAILP